MLVAVVEAPFAVGPGARDELSAAAVRHFNDELGLKLAMERAELSAGPAPHARVLGSVRQGSQLRKVLVAAFPGEARHLVVTFGAGMPKSKGWRWVNVWATWCGPCVEEMGMLNRWKDALTADGVDVTFELLSIDEPANEEKLKDWTKKNLPGTITWIRAEEDFPPFLESLGVDKNAAIPIHLLVDPSGQLRCARVGAINEANYGTVRDLLK